jgi:hypothetical protein
MTRSPNDLIGVASRVAALRAAERRLPEISFDGLETEDSERILQAGKAAAAAELRALLREANDQWEKEFAH